LEALQSLFLLGPPWAANIKAGSKEPPQIDDNAAQETINVLKSRIGGKKAATATETDKQIELWCRLVIIRFGVKEDLDEQLKGIVTHLSDPELSVKLQALEILSFLGENAIPALEVVLKLLDQKELAESPSALRTRLPVRLSALHTLGAMGAKALDPIMRTISNPKEEPEVRIAALAALAMSGEKAEPGRERVLEIIKDDSNLKTEVGPALLRQALVTLAAMGVKAQGSVPTLDDLKTRLEKLRDDRLKSPEYQKLMNSPEVKLLLDKLTTEERKKVLDYNPEDEFKKGVQETIRYIKESTPGHPGGEHKKQ
jgi:hypothetical protein